MNHYIKSSIAILGIATLVACSGKEEKSTKVEMPLMQQEPVAEVQTQPTPEIINYDAVHGKVPFLSRTASGFHNANVAIDPFINSALPNPTPAEYAGPLFDLRHDYPTALPAPIDFPWRKVTKNGPITQANSLAYVEALKEYVSGDMRRLIFDYENWQPQKENWWESIWLGAEREPIRGMYVGSGFPAGTLTDQTLDLTTYVLTMYDERAAKTLGNIWGTDKQGAMNPSFTKEGTQYAEGSVIVKFSFVTPCGADWLPMVGAASWQLYTTLNTSNGSGLSPSSQCKSNGSNGNSTTPVVTNVYFMQFDIIVKDSVAAPETGWVFSTLVYDKDAQGKDAWDKMIPLGATWGGNPDVINLEPSALTPPVKVNTALTQNWINPASPLYATVTLGWDGRLSGPNDGAVVTPAWTSNHFYKSGLASAGCFACHSSAQYPMTSFLLPATSASPTPVDPPLSSDSSAAALMLFDPGSTGWMRYFQSRPGDVPMGPAAASGNQPIALDYDMVTAFKAIPMWQAAVKAQQQQK